MSLSDAKGPFGFLHKDNIVAKPGFNRWLVPPASIAIHLCIGSVYAWSVFNPALTRDDVRAILAQSCDRIDEANGEYDERGWSPFYGWGRINARRAVELAAGRAGAAPQPAHAEAGAG